MRSYSVIKAKAQSFANERKSNVYIAKAIKNGHFMIVFEHNTTKNHEIIEEIKPEGE